MDYPISWSVHKLIEPNSDLIQTSASVTVHWPRSAKNHTVYNSHLYITIHQIIFGALDIIFCYLRPLTNHG